MSGMTRRIAVFLSFAGLLLMGSTGLAATTAAASPGDIGWEGPSYGTTTGSPSESKPESKLWYNDGAWWADMWDTATADFYVHKLNLATHTWVKTSTRLDDRTNTRSDTLWDGTHLFVASHAFAEGSSSTAASPSYLRRFSYSSSTGTYTLDPGFPVQINNARSETLVIDEDSQGRIWATWMQNRQIMVAVSSVGGATWGAPFALPVAGTQTTSDDISSILAFGGNRIGILWSNEDEDKMYFVSHLDTAAGTTWGARETAYQGTDAADDHINLKNVADQNGRILAAVKTSQSGTLAARPPPGPEPRRHLEQPRLRPRQRQPHPADRRRRQPARPGPHVRHQRSVGRVDLPQDRPAVDHHLRDRQGHRGADRCRQPRHQQRHLDQAGGQQHHRSGGAGHQRHHPPLLDPLRPDRRGGRPPRRRRRSRPTRRAAPHRST